MSQIVHSKLISLLRSLNDSEIKRLGEFVVSDYFNKDSDLRSLFAYLQSLYPAFPEERLRKEHVFRLIYPGRAYDDKQLRYLISRLNKLVEHFLVIQKIEQTSDQYHLALLKALSERGLEKSYRQVNRTLRDVLENHHTVSDTGDLFLARFQWSALKEEHFKRQRVRRYDENIQIASLELDRFYFLHRLRIACAMLDRQTILQAEYQHQLSADWIHFLEEKEFFGEAIIKIYYIIFQALSRENEETYFLTLKNTLNKEDLLISKKDLRDIYLFAINYCARKIRKGKNRYAEEALLLYRKGIETGMLIDNDELSPWTFTNVVKLSLRMRQYEEIEAFIHLYAPLLPEAFRENALHYNLAELYYYTGRFEKAQELLPKVAFTDLNYYLGARVILAKILYETQAEEALLSLLASFTMFLKRNKEISNDLKTTYLNFCKLLFQILSKPPSKRNAILQLIQTTEQLTDRAWLEAVCQAKK